MSEKNVDQPAIKKEQRRGARFPVVVPVEVKWRRVSGETLKETAQAKEVNAQGGLLYMTTYPDVGRRLELKNLVSGEATEARVVAIRSSKDGTALGAAIELVVPNESFWGVNFQLRKTSADLAKLEQAIRSGGAEPRILREFRDSVDYVRKTAWAVQEWQERQLLKRDPQTLLPLLVAERIRRATQLCVAVTTDLTAHEVTRENVGIDELFATVESLYQRIALLFKNLDA